MLQDSKIEIDQKSLTISLTPFGTGRSVLFALFGLVFAYWIIYQFANSELAETYPQIKFVYLLPIFLLWDLYKKIKKLILGNQFRFDKQLNELTINGTRKSRLDEIEAIEINYSFKYESNDKFLELKLQNSEKIRIRDFGSKNAMVNDGREIARFLKITMIENSPLGKELLWGEIQLDSSSINHLNEHLINPDNSH